MNGGHEDMKYFIRRNFGECQTLMDLVDCTPPHQIQRRRIEVTTPQRRAQWYSSDNVVDILGSTRAGR